MAPKKVTQPLKTNKPVTFSKSGIEDRAKLINILQKIDSQQKAFKEVVSTLDTYSSEKLTELQQKIDAKNEEYEILEKNILNDLKDSQIQIDQELKEYKLEACKKICDSLSKVIIPKEELEATRKELSDLKNNFQKKCDEILKEEQTRSKIALNSAVSNAKVALDLEVCKLQSENQNKSKEIKLLQDLLENQKLELQKQRELTQKVAEAGSKAQISQNIGKT